MAVNLRLINPISYHKYPPKSSRRPPPAEPPKPNARQRKLARLIARGETVLEAMRACRISENAAPLGWYGLRKRTGFILALKEELEAHPELRPKFLQTVNRWRSRSVPKELMKVARGTPGTRRRPTQTPASKEEVNADIKHEIHRALAKLGAPPMLLAVVGSWGDTMNDEEVLEALREWNETGRIDFESYIH